MIAIYVRVSSNYQKIHGFSIPQQLPKITTYISLNFPDSNYIKICNDSGYSGRTLQRPRIQKLIRDIEDRKIIYVIYTTTDRLSLSVVDYNVLLTFFLKNNIKFICIDSPIESPNAVELLKSKIDGMFAKYETQRMSERTMEGMKGVLRKQLYPFGGKTPNGYRIKNKEIKIHRQESRAIRQIFKTFVNSDLSLQQLTEHYSLHTKSTINCPIFLKTRSTVVTLFFTKKNLISLTQK